MAAVIEAGEASAAGDTAMLGSDKTAVTLAGEAAVRQLMRSS
jgi:hypothetical protein